MPEAPPFPFNSAGTLYMYSPASLTTISNSNGYQQDIQENENEDLIINSSSSPSKDSNDENHQPRPCSIADAPLTLVTSDDLHEDNLNDEQHLIKEEEEEENKRII
jgi:hypothetical protein